MAIPSTSRTLSPTPLPPTSSSLGPVVTAKVNPQSTRAEQFFTLRVRLRAMCSGQISAPKVDLQSTHIATLVISKITRPSTPITSIGIFVTLLLAP